MELEYYYYVQSKDENGNLKTWYVCTTRGEARRMMKYAKENLAWAYDNPFFFIKRVQK